MNDHLRRPRYSFNREILIHLNSGFSMNPIRTAVDENRVPCDGGINRGLDGCEVASAVIVDHKRREQAAVFKNLGSDSKEC
ncbi:MAG: hypothetical protein KDA84_15720 [Planctomycetaceae bacterium]|nr:hypothetical protein [Planctomycetaceae bacterium]